MKPPLINAETTAGLPGTKKLLLSETGGFLPGKITLEPLQCQQQKLLQICFGFFFF